MRKGRIIGIAAGAAVLLAVLLVCNLRERRAPVPEVIALDVGEGSATLIRTSGGCILIDAGSEDRQAMLCERLRSLGVRQLELLILTHPDEDHIGGADGVLRTFPVREIWTNGERAESDSYDTLLRAAENVPMRTVSAGEVRAVGEATVCVLSPDGTVGEEENENGLVLMVTVRDTRLLLMGDAGEATEARLLEAAAGDGSLRADILFAGHHGSNSACSAAFLSAVAPREIVISCGADNPYGHPDGRALERMRAVCGSIRRTDREGDIHLDLSEE